MFAKFVEIYKKFKKMSNFKFNPIRPNVWWKISLTNFDQNMAKLGQNFDQIWPFSKFQNHSQGFTYFDYQNLKYGPKMLLQLRIIQISQFFLRISKASLTMTI